MDKLRAFESGFSDNNSNVIVGDLVEAKIWAAIRGFTFISSSDITNFFDFTRIFQPASASAQLITFCYTPDFPVSLYSLFSHLALGHSIDEIKVLFVSDEAVDPDAAARVQTLMTRVQERISAKRSNVPIAHTSIFIVPDATTYKEALTCASKRVADVPADCVYSLSDFAILRPGDFAEFQNCQELARYLNDCT